MQFQFDLSMVIWAFIGGLILIVIYFLKRLIDSVDATKNSINEFRECFSTEKQKFTDFSDNCAVKTQIINKRLDDHSKRLGEHDKQIVCLEAKLEKN